MAMELMKIVGRTKTTYIQFVRQQNETAQEILKETKFGLATSRFSSFHICRGKLDTESIDFSRCVAPRSGSSFHGLRARFMRIFSGSDGWKPGEYKSPVP